MGVVIFAMMLFLFTVIGIGIHSVFSQSDDVAFKYDSDTSSFQENKSTKSEVKLTWEQEYNFKKANATVKCKCGITSRTYQFKGEYEDICPQCNEKLSHEEKRLRVLFGDYSIDKEYPFAPKLSTSDFLVMWDRKQEMTKIKKELLELEEYDKEIEAWEEIQLRKMKEYEAKANEIKAELAKSGAS